MSFSKRIRGGSTGSGITYYQLGDPNESGVVAQWIFNEASGDILDQVGSVDLTPTQTGVTSYITYNAEIGYSDKNEVVTPYLELTNNNSNRWSLQSAATSLAFGTGDGTLEWIARYTPGNAGAATGTIYYTCDNSVALGSYFYYDNTITTPRFNFYFKASDGTGLSGATVLGTNIFDGQWHKHRIILDRAGDAVYKVDGVTQATISMATLAGKILPCSQVIVGAALTSAINPLAFAIAEMRQSSNATNNSGGPGGG